MKDHKWEVIVTNKPWNMSRDIYLIERGYKTSLAHIVKGQLEMTEVKEGSTDPEPTMNIPWDVWEALKVSLIDTKIREKSEVEAELGATKYHLEDMRKLLKLSPITKPEKVND